MAEPDATELARWGHPGRILARMSVTAYLDEFADVTGTAATTCANPGDQARAVNESRRMQVNDHGVPGAQPRLARDPTQGLRRPETAHAPRIEHALRAGQLAREGR